MPLPACAATSDCQYTDRIDDRRGDRRRGGVGRGRSNLPLTSRPKRWPSASNSGRSPASSRRRSRSARPRFSFTSRWSSAVNADAPSFRFQPRSPLRLAVLISGGGTTLENLIAKIRGRRARRRASSGSSPAIRPPAVCDSPTRPRFARPVIERRSICRRGGLSARPCSTSAARPASTWW